MDIKTILVATDYSDDAKAAVGAAIDLAKAFDANLHLVNAYHVEIPAVYGGFGGDFIVPQDLLEPLRRSAEASMNALLKELTDDGNNVEGHVVMEYPSRAILDEATRISADMIVVGTRGLTGIKHVIVGSTAERVVRLADCPVLTIKAKETE